MNTFKLEGRDFIELHNLLKILGLTDSGGQAKFFIASGQVSVDGKVEYRKRCKIRQTQVVEFNAQKIIVLE